MVQNVRKAVVEVINCGTNQCSSRVRNGTFFLTITRKLQNRLNSCLLELIWTFLQNGRRAF